MRILGSRIDAVTLNSAAEQILDWARTSDQPHSDATRIVVTVNPEILVAARRDDALATVLAEAALVVPDGIGVVMASRLAGQPMPERVPGIELMLAVLQGCAQSGLRPFFLGARPEVMKAAVEQVRQRYPQLSLAGSHHGYFAADDPTPVRQIAASGADLLFAGMGADRELQWLYDHRHSLNVPVAMGVGGSFDVISGNIRRAPLWMQRCHLEWLYRLLSEPRRWRRQTALPVFAVAVIVEQLRRRLANE